MTTTFSGPYWPSETYLAIETLALMAAGLVTDGIFDKPAKREVQQ